MNKKSKIIATTLIYFVMIITAITEGLINIFTVPIKNDFHITDTKLSLMFMFGTIAYLICNYVGGALCEKIGQKKLFLIWITGQAIAMNLTHFAYGVGLSASQKLSGVLMTDGVGWRRIYIGSAILTIIVFVMFLFIKLPSVKREKEEEKISLLVVLQDKLVWFFFIGLGFYIMAEQGTGRWLPTYIKSTYNNMTESKIASYISIFFLLLTIGRLIGGFIVEKIGAMKAVKIFSLIGGILFVIGLLVGKNGLYIVSSAGFFFSIMFPTIVVIISNTFKKNTAYITGIIIALGSVVNTVLSLLVGVISDSIGIKYAVFIMPVSILITFVFLVLASKVIKSR